MNIDLLANLIGELAVEHDEVALPEVGTFVADLSPAVFSDKGYTIVPPYRKLSFRQRMSADTLLVDLYSSRTGKSAGEASEELRSFLIEMKEILKARKVIIFPGLGRLRATKENMFFFVQDADLDIYPDGFGLDQVSLKSHQSTEFTDDVVQETARETAGETVSEAPLTAVAAAQLSAPVPDAAESGTAEVPEPVAVSEKAVEPETAALSDAAETEKAEEPETVEGPEAAVEPEKAAAPGMEKKPEAEVAVEQTRSFPTFLKVLIAVLAVLLLVAALLAVLGRVAPEFVDRFLYSAEDYKLLHG